MKLKTRLLTVAGFICIGLGVVGIVLPIMPTTPFLLLAVFCFLKAGSRYGEWIMKNRYLAAYLENYRTGAGVPLSVKVTALAVLWGGLTISMLVLQQTLFTIILLAVGAAVSCHLLSMKTKK